MRYCQPQPTWTSTTADVDVTSTYTANHSRRGRRRKDKKKKTYTVNHNRRGRRRILSTTDTASTSAVAQPTWTPYLHDTRVETMQTIVDIFVPTLPCCEIDDQFSISERNGEVSLTEN